MGDMGRKRINDKHLPPRVYRRHGALFYAQPSGPWLRLAGERDLSGMYTALGALLATANPTNNIEQLVQRYCIDELSQKAKKTQRGRLQEFKPIIKAFGPMAAEDVEPHHVWQYFQARGKTEQSRHEIRAFSTLLTYARRIGARKAPNPCFGLQLPLSKPRSRYVSDDQFLFVRGLAQPMVGYAMDVTYLSGIDEGTIRTLERRNFTEEGIQFDRSKTGKSQFIEYSEDLRLTIKAIWRERPQLRRFLICNRKGEAYSANGFQSQWQRLMRRAEAKAAQLGSKFERFHFHDLRAKSASDADSDQEAADRLGHGDVSLTRAVYRRLPQRAVALSILNNVQNIEQGKKS